MAIEKYQKHDREVEKKSCENLMNQQRERENFVVKGERRKLKKIKSETEWKNVKTIPNE
jgi:hypothetical protein